MDFIKRHTRPNPQRNIKGGIAEREAPIHVTNVMMVCGEQQADADRSRSCGRAQGADRPSQRRSAGQVSATKAVPRIKKYHKQIAPRLMKERKYPSVMAVPKLKKIVVNMGVGEATQNIKLLDAAMEELGRITGQKPAVRRARSRSRRSSCAQGMPIGATVTLRGDRCTSSATGCSTWLCRACATSAACRTNSFDGRGNYTLGLKDQLIFPEIDYAKVEQAPWHERDLRDHGPDRRGVEAPPPVPRHAVPEPVGGEASGEDVAHCQGPAKPKFGVRRYTRCRLCGRPRGI